jgi:general secretion pathway protein N
MMSSPRLSAIVVLASTFAVSVGLAANNPPRFDPRDDSVATPGAPRLGIEPIAPAPEPAVTGNPLWGIPLKSLTATRERPIFSPSRRPPAPVVAAAPVEPAKAPPPPPPPPAEPERPALKLLGIVSGASDGFAIFISDTTRDIIRLKTGEGHEGWILRSVKAREAVLEKNRRSAVIELPPPMGDRK